MILCREETGAVFLGLFLNPTTTTTTTSPPPFLLDPNLNTSVWSRSPRAHSQQTPHRRWTPTSPTRVSPSAASPSTMQPCATRTDVSRAVCLGFFFFFFQPPLSVSYFLRGKSSPRSRWLNARGEELSDWFRSSPSRRLPLATRLVS